MAPPPSAVALEAEDDTTGVFIPDVLTVDSVKALRGKSGKLVAGVAAKADIELFKGRGRHEKKAKAKRWDRRHTSTRGCATQ